MKIRNNITGELVEISEEERKKLIDQGLLPLESGMKSVSSGQDDQLNQVMQVLAQASGGQPGEASPQRVEAQPNFSREATDKNFLEKVGNFLLKNITSTGQLAVRGGQLKSELPGTSDEITRLGQQSRELIAQAQATDDPAEKQMLLDQSRQISQQIDQLGAGVEQQAETMIDRGNVSEADLGRSNLDFALRRGGATALEAGAVLAPFAMGAGTAIGGMSKLGNRAVTGAVTGGFGGLADASAQAENIGEAAQKFLVGTAAGAGSSVVMGMLTDWATGAIKNNPLSKWISKTVDNVFNKNKKQQDTFKRALVSQTLSPRHKMLEQGLIEEGDLLGVNETIEFIANSGLPPDAKILFAESIKQKDAFDKVITSFLSENADDLPQININKLVEESLDSEIDKAMRIEDDQAYKILMEMKKKFMRKGEMNFKDAYQLARDLGSQVSQVYEQGKAPSDVSAIKTRVYTLLNNKLRPLLAETAENAGHGEWAGMMNNYHQWSITQDITRSVLADKQGPIGSVNNAIFKRLLPMALAGNLKYAALGGVAGGIYGAASPEETVLGGATKGAGVGFAAPNAIKVGQVVAPFAADKSAKALQYLVPQTGRSLLQNYMDTSQQGGAYGEYIQ